MSLRNSPENDDGLFLSHGLTPSRSVLPKPRSFDHIKNNWQSCRSRSCSSTVPTTSDFVTTFAIKNCRSEILVSCCYCSVCTLFIAPISINLLSVKGRKKKKISPAHNRQHHDTVIATSSNASSGPVRAPGYHDVFIACCISRIDLTVTTEFTILIADLISVFQWGRWLAQSLVRIQVQGSMYQQQKIKLQKIRLCKTSLDLSETGRKSLITS